MASNARVIVTPGLLFEYREDGRLVGIVTGFIRDRVGYLQHLVIWPGAPAHAMPRMLRAIEARAWEENIDIIALDVEHVHPFRKALCALALRRGYVLTPVNEANSTWFRKVRP